MARVLSGAPYASAREAAADPGRHQFGYRLTDGSGTVGRSAHHVRNRSMFVVAALMALSAPCVAFAQSDTYFDRNNNVGVRDRPRPDYQALGVEAGSFLISPQLTIAPEYDDNIFATDTNKIGDLVTAISPSVRVASNWVRNEVDVHAQATSDVYASHSEENTTDYDLGANGRLDIKTGTNVSAGFDFAHNTIPRTGENSVSDSNVPVQYDQVAANVGAVQTLNRLRFTENAAFNRISYDNSIQGVLAGAPLDLMQYDSNYETVTGRADYALNPEISIFASTQLNNRSYDEQPPAVLLNRNSTGFEVTAGSSFDITRLVRGSIEVGYLEQNYVSSKFHQVSGPTVHANVEYFLSELTTISANLNRVIDDAIDPTAVSFEQTKGGISIDHELLRNVIISGSASYETDDFTGIDRDDKRISLALSGTYLVNRHLGVTAGYSLLDETSSGLSRGSGFLVNVLSLSFVFQL